MASSSIQMKSLTPAGANVETKPSSLREVHVVRISKSGRRIVTPAKLFDGVDGEEENEDAAVVTEYEEKEDHEDYEDKEDDDEEESKESKASQANSHRRKRSRNTRASIISTSLTPKKQGGAVWADGKDELAYDASCAVFLNLNLEARTRAYAATLATLPGRPQEFEELLGAAAHQANGASGPERGNDPNKDNYKAVNDACLGSNAVNANRRYHLLAKLVTVRACVTAPRQLLPRWGSYDTWSAGARLPQRGRGLPCRRKAGSSTHLQVHG
jgi:hypothetical protein